MWMMRTRSSTAAVLTFTHTVTGAVEGAAVVVVLVGVVLVGVVLVGVVLVGAGAMGPVDRTGRSGTPDTTRCPTCPHVASIVDSPRFSCGSTLKPYTNFVCTMIWAVIHQADLCGGVHSPASRSLLERLDDAVTAKRLIGSLANR
jgi:hypothetical protein